MGRFTRPMKTQWAITRQNARTGVVADNRTQPASGRMLRIGQRCSLSTINVKDKVCAVYAIRGSFANYGASYRRGTCFAKQR
ncbi:hypothetical protein V1517DRAFT_209795 [Lipomyces orientalis]|uniref:Uncharacterized protein n=1 Tax=Lipomyces orientalis TaxID=1233043 RepID=A0ACC3THQ9_9ASCO